LILRHYTGRKGDPTRVLLTELRLTRQDLFDVLDVLMSYRGVMRDDIERALHASSAWPERRKIVGRRA
jgi:hypothetical protein